MQQFRSAYVPMRMVCECVYINVCGGVHSHEVKHCALLEKLSNASQLAFPTLLLLTSLVGWPLSLMC